MAKIDRLGWAAGIAFVSHGARIGVRVNDPAVLGKLPEHLPPGWKHSSSPVVDSLYSLLISRDAQTFGVRRYNLLYGNSVRLARTMDLDEVFATLESSLHFNVAVGARRRIFVHAGVVGWRGRAIVIPGRSMSGKTTLVAELVRIGATYYSDEFAAFDVRGRVHPYARPLMVREEAKEQKQRYTVEALGGRAGTRPLPVGLVFIAVFQPGAKWRPRVLTPGQALMAMMGHTVLARLRPQSALKFLQPVALGAIVLKGQRGEAREIAEELLSEIEEPRSFITPQTIHPVRKMQQHDRPSATASRSAEMP